MHDLTRKFHGAQSPEGQYCQMKLASLIDEAKALLAKEPQVALDIGWQLINSEEPELKESGMIIIETWRHGDKSHGWMVSHEFTRTYHEICVLWLAKEEITKAQVCLDKAMQHYSQGALDPDKELAFDLLCAQCRVTPTVEALRKVDELVGEDNIRMSRLISLAYHVCSKVPAIEGITALQVAERSNAMAIRISLTMKYLEVARVDEALGNVESIMMELTPEDEAFCRVTKLHAHVLLHAPNAAPEVVQASVQRFINLPGAPAADCLEIIRKASERNRPFALQCLRNMYGRLSHDCKVAAYKLELFFLSQEDQTEQGALTACSQLMALLDQLDSTNTTWPQHFQEYVAHILWFFASLFINSWLPRRREETIALLKRRHQWNVRNSGPSDRKTCRILCLLLMETDVIEAKKYSQLGLSAHADREDDLHIIDLMLDLQMSTDIDVCMQRIEKLDEQGLRLVLPKSTRYPVAKKRILELLWQKGERTLACVRSMLALDHLDVSLQANDDKCLAILDDACIAAQNTTAEPSLIAGTHEDHLRWIVYFAWNRGMHYVHSEESRVCAVPFLEKCLRLTKMLPMSDDLLGDMRTLITAIQTVLMTNGRKEDYQKAFEWCGESKQVREACEKKGINGNESSYIVEFEVRLNLHDPNILSFIEKVASSPLSMESLLHMARVAADGSQRQIATELVNVYIRNCNARSGGTLDYAALGPAYRTLITMQNPADSFAQMSYVKNLIDENTPEKEVSWLVATAWNVGSLHYKRREKVDAQKWMRLAIDLSPFCGLRDKLDSMKAMLSKCEMYCGMVN